MKTKLLIGCDPEFFLWDKKKNAPVSAHDVVPGDKKKPFKLPPYGAVQADGTACEFNIAPAATPEDFTRNIEYTLSSIRAMVPKNFEFAFTPAVHYEKAYFDALPNFSKELGCDPDYNAYTGLHNPPPNAQQTTMRTGAGHIHLGWTKDQDPSDRSHMWDCCEITKALDNTLGAIEPLWDNSVEGFDRRRLYGKKGAFRPKPYGCEYRVLSNAWLKKPKLWPWLFEAVQHVFKQAESGSLDVVYMVAVSYTDEQRLSHINRYWRGPRLKQEFLNA